MSEYRSVNFYELCRLCAASQGTKVNLFSDNGRKQQLVAKIAECLPVAVDENDSLPKTICELCVQQLQLISEYRQKCVNTQTMLEGCLGTNKLKNEGRVYIKDEAARAGPGGCKPAINIVTLKNSPVKPTLVPLATQQQQQTQQVTQVDSSPMTMSGNDYLNNLVGIKMEDGSDQAQQPQQYSFTIKEIQSQALNDQQRMQTYSQVDEFLKPKTDVKPQYNFVLNQGNQLQQITTTSSASPQLKQIMPTSQPNQYVLTTNSGMRTVTAQQQQPQQTTSQKTIQMMQSQPKQQCIVMKDQNQQVYQLKLEPQMSTVDGQTIYQLNPVHQTFQTVTSPHSGKMVSGSNMQFTTLTNSTKSSPTMISIQDTPGKGQTATQITPVGRIASTTITRKTPLVLKDNQLGQVKYITSPGAPGQPSQIFVQSPASNNGNKVKVLNKNVRTVVVGSKTVKMISSQPGVKTVTVATPQKFVPLQQISAASTDIDDLIQYDGDKGKPPTCDVCQKTFKRREHLVQHLKLHQGVRPFKCDQCEKAFNRKEHLLRHRTSHTGAKSFKCEHCQKMFSRKDNLNKHKRKHTAGEEEDGGAVKKFKGESEVEEDEIEEEEVESSASGHLTYGKFRIANRRERLSVC